MRMQITDQAINKASRDAKADGKRRELTDAGCRGLRIRITPAGSRGWILGARDKLGQARRFNLGAYPTMGISAARDAARGLHHKIKHEGADPIAEKRRNAAIGDKAKAGVGTLKAMLDVYEKTGNPPKSWGPGRPRVELVFREVLDRPCAVLTVGDLQLAADDYPFPKSAAFAVRTLHPVLNWASKPGRAYAPPDLVGLSSPAKITARKRILSAEELRATLPHLRAPGRPYAAALRFMLLTLTRRQETALARWGDVDTTARTWTITATKNGEPHTVPLSRQAMELLLSRLPVDSDQPDPAALIFATSTGAPLGGWDRATKAMQAASGTAGWHRHDLRRTGATLLGEMGELPDIIEAALNHVSIRSPLAATYNRSRYRPQVAAALQRLADALDGIEAGAATVVRLHS